VTRWTSARFVLGRRLFSDDLVRDLGGDPEAQGL